MRNHEMNLLSLINSSLEVFTVAQHCLIIFQLGLKDSSRSFTEGCGMSFVSYSHLIFLISGRTFEVTVAFKFF